jgi:lipopolysaccharide biosynthesis protein
MKLIAFYLPQFHAIPENDAWWGEGFTEWVNTQKAKPLFDGHHQPREPYNNFYYNLLDPKTRRWQAEIAEKYGIYGFCYYHYWFKGKKLLERPLEQVIDSGEPDLPFCLSWANESWTRAWDAKDKQVLINQEYGDESNWEEHFNYLLKIFKDKRYIKVDNKPLFVIYRPSLIERCDEMMTFWNELAKKNGLGGIYFVNTLSAFQECTNHHGFDAQLEFEPNYTVFNHMDKLFAIWRKIYKRIAGSEAIPTPLRKLFLVRISYDRIWSKILSRVPSTKKTFLGAFVDWDNSARKGYNAYIFEGASPKKFEDYLVMQIKRSKELFDSDFLFINAWNEWAEGTYLEPDKKYGYAYLEAVRNAIARTKQSKKGREKIHG